MSECVVIAVAKPEEWPRAPGGGRRIPAGRVCTVLQPSREVAEAEALRLAIQHPESDFVVMEAVAVARHQPVPTHVALGGRVIASRPGAVLTTPLCLPEQPPF
ncbi:MAG: hypothetical protein ACLGJD_05460 [Gammaproteobacteria bacterium]